jgi:hypothetical protein
VRLRHCCAGGFPAELEISGLAIANRGDGTSGVIMTGAGADEFYADVAGKFVAVAGDINGDGIGDMMIGAYRAQPIPLSSGAVYVVFGRNDGFQAEIELEDLHPVQGGDGTDGFILVGESRYNWLAYFGVASSSAGDINGDGLDDMLASILGLNRDIPGRTYVIFGRSTPFPPMFEVDTLLPGTSTAMGSGT